MNQPVYPRNAMPSVSIIVPCYNEQATIRKLLEAIYAQTYPQQNLEVVIADGFSTDATRAEINFFANAHPNLAIKVVDNPKRHIPAGLNCAMKESRGGIIIRLDAHSTPYPDYVECCVKDLAANLGDNVGGIWEIKPGADNWIAKSIAIAAAHPLGVGDALYRHGTKAALVDTVPFGAFKRGVLALVGFFDETLLANEDYEFNARIRKTGGRIWLDPAIRSVYFSRSSLGGLAKQYFNYGYWKWRMLRRYPDTLRWRQGLPPVFVMGILLLGLAGIIWNGFWIPLSAVIGSYLIILVVAGIRAALHKRTKYLLMGLPLAIATMHICWGAGFLWSMIGGKYNRYSPEQN